MGWSAHFLFVYQIDAAEAATRLGGALTGKNIGADQATSTSDTRAPAVGPDLDGWRLIADPHWQLINDAYPAALSTGTRLVRLAVEEHVMFAEAALWQDGQEQWAITSDDDTDIPELSTRGEVPDNLQGDADTPGFDIPVQAVEQLIGWRYDKIDPRVDDAQFRYITGIPDHAT